MVLPIKNTEDEELLDKAVSVPLDPSVSQGNVDITASFDASGGASVSPVGQEDQEVIDPNADFSEGDPTFGDNTPVEPDGALQPEVLGEPVSGAEPEVVEETEDTDGMTDEDFFTYINQEPEEGFAPSTGLTDDEFYASINMTEEENIEKQIRTADEKNGITVEDMWLVGGEIAHGSRMSIQGLSNIPDTGLHILSMLSMTPERLGVPNPEIMDYITNRDGTMAAGLLNAGRALGEAAGVAIDEGYSIAGLVSQVLPETQAKTSVGKYAGIFIEGATESLGIAAKMTRSAKGMSMEQIEDLPAFIRPTYKLIKKNPKLLLTQEGWSGAFAALSGTVAYDFYVENSDDPTYAPLIAIAAGIAGGNLKDPLSIPKKILTGGNAMYTLSSHLTKKGFTAIRSLRGEAEKRSGTVMEAFDKTAAGNILNRTVDYLAGPDIKEIPKSLLEQAENDPVLKAIISEITTTLNTTGDFGEALLDARRTQDAIEGLVPTTVNITDDAIARGLGADFGQVSPEEAMKVYFDNRKATHKYFQKAFEKGDPEEVAMVRRLLQEQYNQDVKLSHDLVISIEDKLLNIQHLNRIDDKVAGRRVRKELKHLKDAYKMVANELYKIDPEDKIRLPAKAFKSILQSDEYTSFTKLAEGGATVKEAYGKAITKTIKERVERGEINLVALESKFDMEASAIFDEILKGNPAIINNLPDDYASASYNNLQAMVKTLFKASDAAFDSTTVGGGSISRDLRYLASSAQKDLSAALRKTKTHGKAADQYDAARDFYSAYLGQYFDPKLTSVGKILNQKQEGLAALSNHKVLDEIFQNPDELDKFIKLTDPNDIGAVLLDPEGAKFAQYIADLSVPVVDMTAEVQASLRKTMEAHIMSRAVASMADNLQEPRLGIKAFIQANETSLDSFPELKRELRDWSQSPTLDSPELEKRMDALITAQQDLDANKMNVIFGGGDFNANSLEMLSDTATMQQTSAFFDAVDTSGSLRSTFVNAAIRSALKPDSDGVLDPEVIHRFIEQYGDNLRLVAGDETMETLEFLAKGAKITERSNVAVKNISVDTEPHIPLLLKQLPKIWTSLRARETFGANRTRLALIHAGSLGTDQFLKMDKKAQDKIAIVYAAILSDPDVAYMFQKAAKRWADAPDTRSKEAAEAMLGSLFFGFGMPRTSAQVSVNVGLEGNEDIQEKRKEAEAEVDAAEEEELKSSQVDEFPEPEVPDIPKEMIANGTGDSDDDRV